jgi:hypothetical protein
MFEVYEVPVMWWMKTGGRISRRLFLFGAFWPAARVDAKTIKIRNPAWRGIQAGFAHQG